MNVASNKKQKTIDDFKQHERDTGSSMVQIALLTERINSLGEHFKIHKKDHHSRRGLLHLINQRRKLLNYLQRVDRQQYEQLIKKLKLRK